MAPYLYGVSSYGLCVAWTLIAGIGVALLTAHRIRLAMWRVVAMQVLLVLAALVGARGFALYEAGLPWSTRVDSAALSLRYPGGIAAVLVALPLCSRWLRLPVAAFSDVAAMGACAALATIRVGCVLAGCCFGSITDQAWGIRWPQHSMAWSAHVARGLIDAGAPMSLAVHPLQLYFAMWAAVVLAVLNWLVRRRAYPGVVALSFLALHEPGKALFETWRDPFHPALQYTSAAIGVGAILVLLALWIRRFLLGCSRSRSFAS